MSAHITRWFAEHLYAQWLAFLLLSLLLFLLLDALRLPAAILLGSMCAAICAALWGWRVQIAWPFFVLAQGVVGCMIAQAMVPGIFQEMLKHWPLFIATVVSILVASSGLGWLLARYRILPGRTALWGLSPGAATAVVLLADAYGADARQVAFMQYLRIAAVAVVAALVTRIWGSPVSTATAPRVWFVALDWMALAATLALIVGGVLLAIRLRVPAGALLIPLLLGATLQNVGVLTLTLPPWLLAGGFALIGWSIGLRFTRPVLVHCASALPAVLAAVTLLIAICGGFAVLLVCVADVDPLTAYLATSPGGVDSVAIIAASAHVDLPFVMALQTARFVLVMLLGPWIARGLARYMG